MALEVSVSVWVAAGYEIGPWLVKGKGEGASEEAWP